MSVQLFFTRSTKNVFQRRLICLQVLKPDTSLREVLQERGNACSFCVRVVGIDQFAPGIGKLEIVTRQTFWHQRSGVQPD